MATKTFNFKDAAAGTSNFGSMQDGSTITDANATQGWKVAKNTASFGYMKYATANLTWPNQAGPLPDTSGPSNTNADCWRTENAYSGSFASGTWNFKFGWRTTTSCSGRGRLNMRLWRSANQDGSSATEITSGLVTSTITTANLSISSDNITTASVDLGTVNLSNEYLFLKCAWEITTAAGSSTANVTFRVGTTYGYAITTPDFTAETEATSRRGATASLKATATSRRGTTATLKATGTSRRAAKATPQVIATSRRASVTTPVISEATARRAGKALLQGTGTSRRRGATSLIPTGPGDDGWGFSGPANYVRGYPLGGETTTPAVSFGGSAATYQDSASVTGGASPRTVPAPSSIANGDILILTAGATGTASGTLSQNDTGWTQVYGTCTQPVAGAYRALWVWWKRTDGSQGSVQISSTLTGGWISGSMVAYRGCVASGSPIDAASTDATGFNIASPSIPQISTSVANTRVVCSAMVGGGTYYPTSLTGPCTATDLSQTGTPQDFVLSGARSATGNTGNQGWTWSDSSAHSGAGGLLALAPAAGITAGTMAGGARGYAPWRVIPDSVPLSYGPYGGGTEVTVRRAAKATLQATATGRRAAKALPQATATSRRAGKTTPQVIGTSRRAGKASLQTSGTDRRAGKATLQGVATARRAANSLLQATATSRRSAQISPAVVATARRAGASTLRTSGTGRRAAKAGLQATTTARRAAKAGLQAAQTARRAGTSTPQTVRTSRRAGKASLQATGTARRASKTTPSAGAEGTARRAGKAGLRATGTSRRAGTALPKATATARRAAKATPQKAGTSRRAGKASPQTVSTARRASGTTLHALTPYATIEVEPEIVQINEPFTVRLSYAHLGTQLYIGFKVVEPLATPGSLTFSEPITESITGFGYAVVGTEGLVYVEGGQSVDFFWEGVAFLPGVYALTAALVDHHGNYLYPAAPAALTVVGVSS